MPGHIWIPQWLEDIYGDTWTVFLKDPASASGQAVVFTRTVDVMVISHVYEGTIRPGWYPATDPDRRYANCVRESAAGFYYWRFNEAADYIEWDVPEDAAGADRLVVAYYSVVGSGQAEVVKNAGEPSETILGTVDTATGSGAGTTETLTLATPLAAGDTIRMRWPTGETDQARVHGWYCYQSAGAYQGGHRVIPSRTQLNYPSSSLEAALRLAPSGGTPDWVGGIAHQGTPKETSPTYTWKVNGASWSPVAGYKTGSIAVTKDAEVYFDAGNPDLGTLSCAYGISSNALEVDASFTADVVVDTGLLYFGMFKTTGTGYSIIDSAGVSHTIDGSTGTDTLDSTNQLLYRDTPGAAYYEKYLGVTGGSVSGCWIEKKVDGAKCYWKHSMSNTNGVAASTSFGGRIVWTPGFASAWSRLGLNLGPGL